MASGGESERSAASRALLLSGTPGVGKTTIIQKVARQVSAYELRGFFTEEIREGGVRKGFKLISFDGQSSVLAHVDFSSRSRVGKYGVDVAGLEETAASLLRSDPPADLYFIDEIGKMECFSEQFQMGVRRLLDTGQLVVATVAQHGGGFISEVKERPDVAIWEVTRSNREVLPERVIEWVRARLVGD